MTSEDYEREFERQKAKYEYDQEQERRAEPLRLARERVLETADAMVDAFETLKRNGFSQAGLPLDESFDKQPFVVAVRELRKLEMEK